MSGTNKKIILISVALTIPFAVWFGRTVHKEKQPPGGTLYVGLEIPYYNLDVLNSGGLLHPEMTIMNNLMLERLFSLGPSGNIVPELGLSAQMSDDGKRWDIELRSGVVFHDKSPFNADAVAAHWRQILNPENKFRGRVLIEPIRDVKKINDHRVRFYLKHPWGRLNELAAKDPIDCSDPGDIEAVKSGLLGSWKGRDNYGAIIKGTFYENGTVKASRNDRVSTSKYTVCGNTVFWRPPGALLIVNLENDQLKGHWEYSGYKGNFTLERVASKTAGN